MTPVANAISFPSETVKSRTAVRMRSFSTPAPRRPPHRSLPTSATRLINASPPSCRRREGTRSQMRIRYGSVCLGAARSRLARAVPLYRFCSICVARCGKRAVLPPDLQCSMLNSRVSRSPVLSRARLPTLVVVSLMTLTACPGMTAKDNERFQALVARNVSPGMPFVTAIQKLVKAGFSCDDRVSAPLVTCSLNRQSLLPYVCIESVDLTADAERRTLMLVSPRPIRCAGL